MRGFVPHSNSDGRVPPWEYMECSAIRPQIGMAMVLSAGRLAIATGTARPAYICMREEDSAVAAGTVIPVIRVDGDQVFSCTCSASLSGVNAGDKVTLHASNGCQVTGTKNGGVATVVAKEGDDAGSRVLVRFE